MKWKLFVVSVVFNLVGVVGAGAVIHAKGGLPWLWRQIQEVKTGTNGPAGNLRLSVFERCPDAVGDIYMVGDSLTAFCEWAELLRDPRVHNRGIAGDTTAGVLARLGEITNGKPSVVCLKIGVNDLQYGWSVADAVGRIREIVRRIHAESPDTKIVLQSVLPINEGLYRQYIVCLHPEVHMPTTEEVRALNEGVCGIEGATYLDLWPALVADGQLRREFTYDGLHVNGQGYDAWAQAIKPLIQ